MAETATTLPQQPTDAMAKRGSEIAGARRLTRII